MSDRIRRFAARVRHAQNLGVRAYSRRVWDLWPWRCIAYWGEALPWAAPGLGRTAHAIWPHKGQPLNAQCAREAIVRELVAAWQPEQIIETGTYRGATTEFFARMGSPGVWSSEVMAGYHFYAKRRLRQFSNVQLFLGDSRVFLTYLASRPRLTAARCLFYLDAHWYTDLPLAEEIGIIRRDWQSAVVVIDDFEVPGDPGYEFDDYGPGARLALDCLGNTLQADMDVYFPRVASADESGAKRGCVVLAWGRSRAAVSGCATLRPMVAVDAEPGAAGLSAIHRE